MNGRAEGLIWWMDNNVRVKTVFPKNHRATLCFGLDQRKVGLNLSAEFE